MKQAIENRTPLQRLLWLGGMAKAAGGKGVEETASGNPVVFTTDIARPLSRLTLSLLPRQSGTGDPSPENVRPITGWTGLNVVHCGKNFAKMQYGNKVPSTSTGEMVSSNGWSSPFIRVDKTKQYCLSRKADLYKNTYVLFYDELYSFIGNVSLSADIAEKRIDTLTYFANCTYIKIRIDATESAVLEVQLEESESASTYEPYTGQTYPVVFPETVYGGFVDLVTGEVWGTHVLWKNNTADMNNESDYPGWKNAGIRDIVGTEKGGAIDTMLNVGSTVAINTRNANDIVYLPKSYYAMTQDEWQALAIDIQVALPLETPVLLATLTPQQISAIVGVNTVWSDADNVDVTYLKKG